MIAATGEASVVEGAALGDTPISSKSEGAAVGVVTGMKAAAEDATGLYWAVLDAVAWGAMCLDVGVLVAVAALGATAAASSL